ncbi:hypothetical protein S245_071984, partial [Arachis hypogaea]
PSRIPSLLSWLCCSTTTLLLGEFAAPVIFMGLMAASCITIMKTSIHAWGSLLCCL